MMMLKTALAPLTLVAALAQAAPPTLEEVRKEMAIPSAGDVRGQLARALRPESIEQDAQVGVRVDVVRIQLNGCAIRCFRFGRFSGRQCIHCDAILVVPRGQTDRVLEPDPKHVNP